MRPRQVIAKCAQQGEATEHTLPSATRPEESLNITGNGDAA